MEREREINGVCIVVCDEKIIIKKNKVNKLLNYVHHLVTYKHLCDHNFVTTCIEYSLLFIIQALIKKLDTCFESVSINFLL